MASWVLVHKGANGLILRRDNRLRKTKPEAIKAAKTACLRTGVAMVERHRWDKPVGNRAELDRWFSDGNVRCQQTLDFAIQRAGKTDG
jgi:hypothetical protein